MNWDDMEFWSTEQWITINARLDTLEIKGVEYNPRRELLFAALDAVPFESVKVVIVGQDPYPNKADATGIAFHTGTVNIPPTLRNIYAELERDYHYGVKPQHGNLTKWMNQGVLLWNAIPTCFTDKPASHRGWEEWDLLTKEIIQRLSDKGSIVFIFLGSFAQEFNQYVDDNKNFIINASHPSPRASFKAWKPFNGSRIFSTCNAYLVELQKPVIDWQIT